MKYRVAHKTEYFYSGTITQCHNLTHLRPRNLPGQQCLAHRLEIDPLPGDYSEFEDFFGNQVSYFSVQQPHRNLKILAVSELLLDEVMITIWFLMSANASDDKPGIASNSITRAEAIGLIRMHV